MLEKNIGRKMIEWLYITHYSTLETLARVCGCTQAVAKTVLYRLVKRGLMKSFKRPEMGKKLLFILTIDGIDLALANEELQIWDYNLRQSAINGRTIKHYIGVQNSIIETLSKLKGEFHIDMNRCAGTKNVKMFDALLYSKDGTGLIFGIEFERTPKSGATLREFFQRIVGMYGAGHVHVVVITSHSLRVLERYRSELFKIARHEPALREYKQMSEQLVMSSREIEEFMEIFCFHRLELQ